MKDQRREHVRYPIAVACELNIDNEIVVAKTQDLSAGGVAILSRAKLSKGHVLSVTLFLTQDGIEDANHPPVGVTASIRWTEPRGPGESIAGMQFISPTQEQRHAVEHLLKQIRSD